MRMRALLMLAAFVNIVSQGWYRRTVRSVLTRFGISVRGLPLWISPNVFFDHHGGITLGDRCVISAGVHLLTHDFSMDRVAERRYGIETDELSRSSPITIGDQSFVGMNSMILPGVTVGDGAIVGAGSVVTRDVAPDTVVAGNPAAFVCDTNTYWERSRSKFGSAPRRRGH